LEVLGINVPQISISSGRMALSQLGTALSALYSEYASYFLSELSCSGGEIVEEPTLSLTLEGAARENWSKAAEQASKTFNCQPGEISDPYQAGQVLRTESAKLTSIVFGKELTCLQPFDCDPVGFGDLRSTSTINFPQKTLYDICPSLNKAQDIARVQAELATQRDEEAAVISLHTELNIVREVLDLLACQPADNAEAATCRTSLDQAAERAESVLRQGTLAERQEQLTTLIAARRGAFDWVTRTLYPQMREQADGLLDRLRNSHRAVLQGAVDNAATQMSDQTATTEAQAQALLNLCRAIETGEEAARQSGGGHRNGPREGPGPVV